MPTEPKNPDVDHTALRARDLEIIRHANPDAFDGHTEFSRLSPNERLTWLESAVRFVQASKSDRPNLRGRADI